MTVFQAASALAAAARRGVVSGSSALARSPGLSAQLFGILGLIVWPDTLPLLWVAVAGAGLGGTFSLTLVTAMDHSADHRVAGKLVAFTQGVGFHRRGDRTGGRGRLRDATGSFVVAWIMLAVCISAMIALTFAFSPRSYSRWLDGR